MKKNAAVSHSEIDKWLGVNPSLSLSDLFYQLLNKEKSVTLLAHHIKIVAGKDTLKKQVPEVVEVENLSFMEKTIIVNKSLEEFAGKLLKKAGTTLTIIDERIEFCDNEDQVNGIAISIMEFAGIAPEYSQAAIHGFPIEECQFPNWQHCYQSIIIRNAVRLADKYMSGDERCEVGLKYPEFDIEHLVSKYRLFESGYFQSEHQPIERSYHVWQNLEQTISLSFIPNPSGHVSYVGLTFPDYKTAKEFIAWLLVDRMYDVKDLAVFFNTLGGLSINQIEEFNGKVTTI